MFGVVSRAGGPISMAIVVVAVVACTRSAAMTSSSPTRTAGSPTPTATIVVMPSQANGSAAVSGATALIPDGTYAGPVQQVADVIAHINADTKLSDADRVDLIDTALEIRGHTTFDVTLDLRAGQWTQSQAVDGRSQVASRATYAFPDDHTVVIQESCCGLTTFGVTLAQGGFSLKVLTPLATEADKVISRILFETGTFTRMP